MQRNEKAEAEVKAKVIGFRLSVKSTGVELMMPWAKGVSAKSHGFDADGNETETDFYKMVKIVLDS